jgi:hypothetical protein
MLSNSASLDPYVPTPGAAPSSTAYYGPRFDYDPVTLLPRGLLVEEARTNLLTYSAQIDDASWAKVRASATANSTTAPDGTVSADTLVEDTTASATHQINKVFTGTAVAHTYSVYVKAAGRTQIRLNLYDGAAFVNQTYFDLTSGTVLSGTGGTIAAVGNGWYRCAITATLAASANCQAQLRLASGGSDTYTGDGTSGVFLWGAQLEAGAFATSYIPTIASTVTRSADVATITGSLFSQWYNQPEGSLIAEASSYVVDTNTRSTLSVYSSGATSNNILLINAVQRQFQINDAGNQADLDGGTPASGVTFKAAGAYKVNDFALSLSGGAVVTDTAGTVPSVNTLAIGVSSLATTPINGHIRSIRYVPVRAADFQLQQVTT